MMAPLDATVIAALIVVRSGGAFGVTLAQFGEAWPCRLPAGQKRKTWRGGGGVVAALHRRGLVGRIGVGRHPRFVLTAAGERLLNDAVLSARGAL